MNVLCALMSDKPQDRQSSRHLLLQLSETAGRDAVSTLRQLRARLSMEPYPRVSPNLTATNPDVRKGTNKQPGCRPGSNSTTHRKPAASLSTPTRSLPRRSTTVRIGWVRSSTDKSSVKHRKPSQVKASNNSFSRNDISQALGLDRHPRPSVDQIKSTATPIARHQMTSAVKVENEGDHSQRSCLKSSPTSSKHSALHQRSRTDQVSTQSLPIPPKIPLDVQPHPLSIPRKEAITTVSCRPLSVHSFLSASTKVGEIPEHKLPAWSPSTEEPYAGLISAQQLKRRKGRLFRFWRRQEEA